MGNNAIECDRQQHWLRSPHNSSSGFRFSQNQIGVVSCTISSMYDNTCRFLAEHFSADFASWLLGEPVTLTEIKPSELSLDPIRADALILLESDKSFLHLEFVRRESRTSEAHASS
jgi:hypothetical protein